MTTLQMLTLRRNTSLGRMATLEKRAERLGAQAAPVVRSALEELSAALDDVQVATEQLQALLDELATVRVELNAVREQHREFVDLVPVASVWTDATGEIAQANEAAAELLNVSAQRLVGRPLVLFMSDRTAFAEADTALSECVAATVRFEAVLRPRERRPRPVVVVGRSLKDDSRRCWFLTPGEPGR